MTTPKEAAAVALAEAYCARVGNPGHSCRAQDEYFASTARIRDAEAAYRALRATPPPPDAVGLSEAEREYLEACYAVDAGVRVEIWKSEADDPAFGATHRAKAATYLALRRARQPEPLDSAGEVLSRLETLPFGSTKIGECVRELRKHIDAALAQKGGSRG